VPIGVAVAAYLWLCLAWFDHDLPIVLRRTPAWAPLALLLVALVPFAVRELRSLSLGRDSRIAAALFAFALVTRLPFVFQAFGLFSSDAAAQGIMALHILEGRHHPIFLYNWSYVGSFKAHLTALLALVSGAPVPSFALAAVLVYAAASATTYLLARTVASRSAALFGALYFVLAPGFLTAWGMGNEGNYLDVLLFGNLVLLVGARWLREESDGLDRAFWMGLCGGVAFWIHILATYYLLAALGILVVHRFGRKALGRVALFAAGFAIGDFPGILWNASNGWLSFRWWSLDASTVEAADRVGRFWSQLGEVLTTSFPVLSGYWPSSSPPRPELVWYPLLAALIPGTFLFFAVSRRRAVARLARGELTPEATFLGFALLVVLVFAQSSFGWMTEEPRYLLFVFSVVPVFVGTFLEWLGSRAWPAAIVVALGLGFVNLRGDVDYYLEAAKSDPLNREFVARLEALGIRHVHSDYHLSYKYVFLSEGRMVWTSELGPAQTEWYLPFREEVDASDDAALVPRSFRFARRIERRLDQRSIHYRREDLLYPVLFDFSEPVRPSQLR
jgi:hypothetical protein